MKAIGIAIGIAIAIAIAMALPMPSRAQSVQTGISRDTIRVGDPFRAVVRIALLPGSDVVLPDSLTPTDDIENGGRVRLRRDSTANGVIISAAYPLTAWRTGPLLLPEINATLKDAHGERPTTIKLPDINVLSVLPADTTNIQAKPTKDVLGGNRLWWPLLLALAIAIAIAIAIAYWWRKKKQRHVVELALPVVMPRDRALEEIERIRKLALVEQKDFKRHYTLISEVLRQYMATTESGWSTDLTTEELRAKTKDIAEVRPAIVVLRQADMVKFAKSIPDTATAHADLDRARDWIVSYPAPQIEAPADAA
jgi:hypothetical protein